MRGLALLVSVGLGFVVGMALPAGAMSLKDCSALYQAAKKNGTLGTRNWSEFRTGTCTEAGPTTGSAAAAAVAAQQDGSTAAAATPAAPAPPAVVAAMPAAIDPKYAAEKPSRARLHTCSDAYRAAKKAGALNGLRWIQPGGGFYSLCNRKLKAAG